MATQQANATQFANDCISAASQLRTLLDTFGQLQARQAAHDFVTTLNNQPTYAVNADGSQGGTDGTPNTAHPIVGIGVAAADLSAFIGYGVNDLVSFLTGAGTPGYTDRRTAIGKLLG